MSGEEGIAPYVLSGLGGLLFFLILAYGQSSLFTLFVGLTLSVGLIWVAWGTKQIWSIFLLNLLAVYGGFSALGNMQDMTTLARFGIASRRDAEILAEHIGCPTWFWSFTWSLLSMFVLGAAFYFTLFRG